MVQAGKPVLVEAFVTEAPVEGFDIGVLVGLAGFDQAQSNAIAVRPVQHGLAGELLAVVGPDDGGASP